MNVNIKEAVDQEQKYNNKTIDINTIDLVTYVGCCNVPSRSKTTKISNFYVQFFHRHFCKQHWNEILEIVLLFQLN